MRVWVFLVATGKSVVAIDSGSKWKTEGPQVPGVPISGKKFGFKVTNFLFHNRKDSLVYVINPFTVQGGANEQLTNQWMVQYVFPFDVPSCKPGFCVCLFRIWILLVPVCMQILDPACCKV
jgi:hypothetical protein